MTLRELSVRNALRNTLEGNAYNNIYRAATATTPAYNGDDTLIGGDGSDGYVYELGDDRTQLETGAGPDDHDVIIIAGG
jgi:hypothetical protein